MGEATLDVEFADGSGLELGGHLAHGGGESREGGELGGVFTHADEVGGRAEGVEVAARRLAGEDFATTLEEDDVSDFATEIDNA